MIRPICLGVVVCLASALSVSAQTDPQNSGRLAITRSPIRDQPPPEIQLQMERFFLQLQNGEIQPAYEALLTGTDLEDRQAQLTELIEKTGAVMKEIGPMTGHELFDSRAAGSRLMAVTYFSFHQKKPLRWRFVFYAAQPDTWRLINHTVDDLIGEAFLLEQNP
ncbi:MAG: hypothetical protein OHK005_11880 [Candidatus Methylacidiphilales bacterium]